MMTATAASSKKLETIRNLLAKAESTTFPDEAEALTAKAMELMVQYGIDDAMLAAAGKKKEEIVSVTVEIRNPYSKNKAQLLYSIALSQNCRAIAHPDPGRRSYSRSTVVGFTSDIERVELLFTSLLLQATRQVVNVHSPHGRGTTEYRKSWFIGFTDAVHERLQAITDHAIKQAESKTPGTEIVLMSRADLVKRHFDDMFSKARTGTISVTRWVHAQALDAGRKAGENADLSQTRFTGRGKSLMA